MGQVCTGNPKRADFHTGTCERVDKIVLIIVKRTGLCRTRSCSLFCDDRHDMVVPVRPQVLAELGTRGLSRLSGCRPAVPDGVSATHCFPSTCEQPRGLATDAPLKLLPTARYLGEPIYPQKGDAKECGEMEELSVRPPRMRERIWRHIYKIGAANLCCTQKKR